MLWLAWRIAAGKAFIRWNPLFAPMLVFLGLVLAQIVFHRTAYLYDSISELWLYIAYGILAFVAVQLFQGHCVVRFAQIMAVFGAVYAFWAVLQGFTGGNALYWLIEPAFGNVYGSYVNHNHYAGLMELLLPFAVVLAVGNFIRGPKKVLLGFSAILMAASVFLCQSRGGMFAIVVEMAFLAVFWMRRFSPRKSAAWFVVFSLLTALLLVLVAPPQLGTRITNIHDPARWPIHGDSVRMFIAHPLFGSGFGTFPAVFPHYREFYDGLFVIHAHDDYLELLLDMGLAGLAVAIWFIVLLYREGLRKLRPARPAPHALIGLAALTACTGILVHSFLDFNLHIPANAALFYVVCAVAVAQQGQ